MSATSLVKVSVWQMVVALPGVWIHCDIVTDCMMRYCLQELDTEHPSAREEWATIDQLIQQQTGNRIGLPDLRVATNPCE